MVIDDKNDAFNQISCICITFLPPLRIAELSRALDRTYTLYTTYEIHDAFVKKYSPVVDAITPCPVAVVDEFVTAV